MREIKKIIVHCSDSEWGDAVVIDQWHKARGWDGIGYHYVITNGRRTSHSTYRATDDGIIETGRPLDKNGAHCRGHNRDSIGVCLIGSHHYSGRQLYEALPSLLTALMNEYGLTYFDVYGHNEFSSTKTCPNIEGKLIRDIQKTRRAA